MIIICQGKIIILSIFSNLSPSFYTDEKLPRNKGIVPIYVSQELFCPFPFLAGSSDEIGTGPVNDPLPIRKAYQNLRRMPAFSFHFLWKSPPISLAKSA